MLDPSTYRIEIDHNRAIVSLLPALNEVSWADIEKIGGDVIAQLSNLSTPLLLVDLSALNYMGSAQVALVVRMFKSVKERGGKLVVANKHPLVLEVLTLAGLNKLWTIVDSRDAALKLLGGSPGGEAAATGMVANGIGMAALIVAVVALVAILTKAAWLPGSTALSLELGAAAVAFFSGLMAMLKGSRTIGVCVLVGSVAVLLAGVFSLGATRSQPTSTPPAAVQAAPSPAASAESPPPADPTTDPNP